MSREVTVGRVRRAESSGEIRVRARELRREQTPPEEQLWQALRDRRFRGLKFRAQHPLGPFIADFYRAEHRLVVEVDGAIHADPEVHDHDTARDTWLRARDVTIVRIPASLILRDRNQALYLIASALEQTAKTIFDA